MKLANTYFRSGIIGLGLLAVFFSRVAGETTPINPHWTGKYCQECHVNEMPRHENALLKFNGDARQLCDRCHTRPCVTNQSHSADLLYRDIPGYSIPSQWPLTNGRLNCLTCHDAVPPMYENFPLKRTNPAFLRGAPYKGRDDFCFRCHTKGEFVKQNPHRQRDQNGTINAKICTVCHKTAPVPRETRNISQVTFKESYDAICIGCHAAHPASHGPASGQHRLSAETKERLEKNKITFNVEIPLIDDRVFCGTCHNPHEKGILQRAAAERGAGEKYFLRLPGGYELCILCHSQKTIKDRTRQTSHMKTDTLKMPPDTLISHQPYIENKCKCCHKITPENRSKPGALFLCFQKGCHKPDLVEKPFEHNKAVLENCYVCHESHASGYDKLLRVNEEVLCYACHPLVKNKNNMPVLETNKLASNKAHRAFADYVKTSVVPVGQECGFCHTMKHRNHIGRMAFETCAACHVFVRKTVQENSAQLTNPHAAFKEQRCSICHEPHASPHPYQLKNSPETYLKAASG